MKSLPLELTAVIDPASDPSRSKLGSCRLVVTDTKLTVGKSSYNISEITRSRSDGKFLILEMGNNSIRLGVQTYGLRNVADDYLTPLLGDLLFAISKQDISSVETLVSQFAKARRTHHIKAIAMVVYFPICCFGRGPALKLITGCLDNFTSSRQLVIRLGILIYFILIFPIWILILKKGKGFAFESSNKQNKRIQLIGRSAHKR